MYSYESVHPFSEPQSQKPEVAPHWLVDGSLQVLVNIGVQFASPWAAKHALSRWRGRPIPWQIDTKNRVVYTGLPRHYFNDDAIKTAIDKGKHQVIHD